MLGVLSQQLLLIVCNGQLLGISNHLYEGLKSIYLLEASSYLWIDAISINQHDDSEKAVQVAAMKDIYKNAVGVHVWLGKEDDASEFAFNYIKTISGALESLDKLSQHVLQNYATFFADLPTTFFESMFSLSSRSWFSRLWVVQELILARHVTFTCGRNTLDGHLLENFALLMSIAHFNRQATLHGVEIRAEIDGLFFLTIAKKLREGGPYLTVGNNAISRFVVGLQWSRLKMVTEPIDRIYGVLGLCEPNDIYSQQIMVDYSEYAKLHLEELHIQIGKLVLVHEPKLHLLLLTSSGSRMKRPSWCPNFSLQPDTHEQIEAYSSGMPSSYHISFYGSEFPKESCSSAHPNFQGVSECHVITSATTSEVKIRGCTVDRIAKVVPFVDLRVNESGGEKLLTWIEECLRLSLELDLPTEDNDEIPEAFWRTFFANRRGYTFRYQAPCRPSDKRAFLLYRGILQKARAWRSKQVPNAAQVASQEELEPLKAEDMNIVNKVDTAFQQLWHNRAFFITEGRRIGFAAIEARPGDSVCVLYTGPTTYILREISTEAAETKNPGSGISTDHIEYSTGEEEHKKYEFISNGYTHGLMDGEAFDLLHEGNIKEEIFTVV